MFNVRVKNFDFKAAAPDILFSDTAQTSDTVEFKYQVNSNVVTHSYDWIGLYQANFESVDDYATYSYAPERIVQFENKRVNTNTFNIKYSLKLFKSILCFKLKKDVLDANTGKNCSIHIILTEDL